MKTYTEEQVKKAFWDTFHKAGELWFSYLATPEDCESDTRQYWIEFLGHLTGNPSGRKQEDGYP